MLMKNQVTDVKRSIMAAYLAELSIAAQKRSNAGV